MGLYDAMNASVTGMNAQSNYLANIGQNIANSGTVGYKEADTRILDAGRSGGRRPDLSRRRLDRHAHGRFPTQGTLESTTSSTDLAVSGNGFFVVSNSAGQQFLTRAGSFVPDASGNLVNCGRLLPERLQSRQWHADHGLQFADWHAASSISASAGLTATPTTREPSPRNLPSTDTGRGTGDDLDARNYSEKTSMVMYDNLGASQTIDLYYLEYQPDAPRAVAADHTTCDGRRLPL